MTLTELFLEHTNSEFPPKHVFAYVGANTETSKVKRLSVKELDVYSQMYEFSGTYVYEDTAISKPVKPFSLPLLKPKLQ